MSRAAALLPDSRPGVAAVLRAWLGAARRPQTVEAIAVAEVLRLGELEALLEPRMVDGGDAARRHALRRLDDAGGAWPGRAPATGEDRTRLWLPAALDPAFLAGLDEPLPWAPERSRGPLLRLVATYLRGRSGRRAVAATGGGDRELDAADLAAWSRSNPPRLLALRGPPSEAPEHLVVDALGGAGAVVWSARPPLTRRPGSPPRRARASG